ncbi:ATP-grasp domain-containing protein [Actinocorallia sp. A-T 12471]|uniref:ATP-grasp domain-containing protein n=1 Tax=Actinocorallia sp. A-T 12471 TaxID=3089813 RepID=UPI0029D30CF7|nr:ATP-grasp domain-containing protein [Actinocorallia sp. A-T 12471]MDX6743451.1 ATP-grasp domain-containing protein [Actinocorallia sp. A-T 12471]
MTLSVLFCADPLRPRRVDEHFHAEAEILRASGGAPILLDLEALRGGDAAEAVRRVPRGAGALWYRGWMLSAAEYHALAKALVARGAPMMTPPDSYQRAHELPGWYDTFAGLTPQSAWLALMPRELPASGRLADVARELPPGPLVVKDYVKSRKHEWDEACYVPDSSDTAALARVVHRMVELQDEFLTGGVVLRAFEEYTTAEARVWWVDGDPVLVGPHPDTPDADAFPDLDPVRPAVRALGCRFVTTDLARRVDGAWRVVEVGDGQVSDLHTGADVGDLYFHLPDPG